MIRPLLLAVLLAAPAGAQSPGGMIGLSTVEALAAIERPELGGVFSFISEKDAPTAFADLVVRDKHALKRFVAKMEKDLKEVKGVSGWDAQVAQTILMIYNSPIAQTLETPSKKALDRLRKLSAEPPLSLAEITARRRKG